MTKAELVRIISDDTGILRKDTAIIVDSLLESIKDCIVSGGRIELRGFGTFRLKVKKAKTGRNPLTGETVEIPKRVVPVFKYSKSVVSDVKQIEPDSIEQT